MGVYMYDQKCSPWALMIYSSHIKQTSKLCSYNSDLCRYFIVYRYIGGGAVSLKDFCVMYTSVYSVQVQVQVKGNMTDRQTPLFNFKAQGSPFRS